MFLSITAIGLLTIVGGIAVTLVYVRFRIFTHWQRGRFPHLAPRLPWGNLASVMLRRSSFGLNIYELYNQAAATAEVASQHLVGVYLLWRPALLLRDPQLIRRVLGSDFAHFHDRGVYSRPLADPISDNLFAMTGQRWRTLRAQLTPMFTSGRLKSMLPILLEKSDNLVQAIAAAASPSLSPSSEVVDMKDFISRYGLDSIASVFFGLDVDTITHRRHKFRIIEKHTNNRRYLFNLVPILIFLCPGFLQFIRLPSVPPTVKAYVMRLVSYQINQREREHIMRKDFMQFLIQIRNTGRLNADDTDWRIRSDIGEVTLDADSNNTGDRHQQQHQHDADNGDTNKTLSIEQCAAQVFLFYLAGFDTSASVASYTIFETARKPSVLARLCSEIDVTLDQHGGKLTYEAIGDMKYLELCVMETVRKYPVLPLLNRICTKDYTVPNEDGDKEDNGRLRIESGTAIVISLLGLGRDPKHFPDPVDYRPERFEEQPPRYNVDAYLPFGDGPRTCIGVRLGKLMAKVAIVKLLSAYRFEALTDAELEFENYGITLHVKGGIPMRIASATR